MFTNGNSNEFDATIVHLMEKNRAQAEEIRNLKLEQESQAILLCEVTEQKKKAMEDKAMIEEEKRISQKQINSTSSLSNSLRKRKFNKDLNEIQRSIRSKRKNVTNWG